MDIILGHRQLDFDALASMVAAQKLYPNSVLVIDGKSNPYVQDYLALSKDGLPFVRLQDIAMSEVSRVILVDTHDLSRTGAAAELLCIPGLKIEIYDHHPYAGPAREGMQIDLVGACTTILVEKIAASEVYLSSFEATLLMLGIYDDTGSLSFESTTVRDVQAVAYLLEHGANLGVVADYLRKPLGEGQRELLHELLDNGKTEIYNGVPVHIAWAETPDYVGGLALLAHRIGELEGVETWFLVVKMENRIYLVGRSRGKGLPVNEIVKVFGGFGHPKSASATIKDQELELILSKLRREISARIQSPYLVQDIMSHPVKTVAPETKLEAVEQIFLRYGHTGVPVLAGEQLVGIISRRDVEKAMKHGLGHAPVKGFMATQVVTVSLDTNWEEVQRLMVQYDIGRLPVVEQGKVVGIVSRSDVLRLVHGSVVPISGALARERSLAMRQDIIELMDRLPDGLRRLLDTVSEAADATGCSVYMVGGFVRDLLLLVPTQDLDLVVEGSGLQFATVLAERFPTAELTLHQQFGTARLSFPDGLHLDVASTRWEYYAFPGALPQVEESCLRDDLYRRDFTINAMAMCLNTEGFGEIVDYYGGMRDLQQGEIRFLHNLSFIDDPTRIMRAVRFVERYNFQFTKEAWVGLQTAIEAGVIREISGERFSEELVLIFNEQNYQAMGRLLVKSGVLAGWFGQELPWNFQVDLASEDLELRWLVALKNMEDQDIEDVLGRTRLTRNLQEVTREYVRLRSALLHISLTLTSIDRLLTKTSLGVMKVLALDDKLSEVMTKYLQALGNVKMAIDGQSLKELGITQGPEIGKMLRMVREAWLEGQIQSPVEEQEFVRHIVTTYDSTAETLK